MTNEQKPNSPPFKVGRLQTIRDCRRFQARLIRAFMDGHLDEKTSKCATYMNNVLVTMHRDSDLETRVAALEEDATP